MRRAAASKHLQRLTAAAITCLALACLPSNAQDPQANHSKEAARPQELTEMSLEQLANVEFISAGRRPEKRSQVAAAVYVITQEDIRRAGVTTIPDALRLVPGVQVAQVDSNKWAIGVRGFASRLSRSLLVLVDGRSVYTPLFAGVYWEVQDTLLEDIDRIEIIRGPGGTVWGANAVSGVINIITKQANETSGFLVSTGGGSIEQGFLGFRYGGKTRGNVHYRVYGKFFNRGGGFHATGNEFDDWNMGQAGFRADWAPNQRDSWTIQGDVYGGRSGQRTAITSYAPPSVQIVEDDTQFSGGNLLSRWTRTINDRSDMSVKVYYDRTYRNEPSFKESRDTIDAFFQYRLALPRGHRVSWGLGYRVSSGEVSAAPTIVFTPPRRTDNLFSTFVQDEIEMADKRVKLTLGSKFEHNGYSGFEAQPSIRLLWAPDSAQTFWTSFSRAVRTPSRVEHDLSLTTILNPATNAFARFLADKDFSSENLLATEAGYRFRPTQKVFLDVALFFNRFDKLLSIEPGTPFTEAPSRTIVPFFFRNLTNGRVYGVENACDWLPTPWWRMGAAYTYLRMNLTQDPGSIDVSTARSAEGSSPRHQVSIRSFVTLPRKFEWDMTYRFVGRLPAQTVDQYSSLDVRLGWRGFEHLELSASGRNLLQGHHPEFGGGASGRTEVKRSAYAKATWRW